MKAVVPHKNIHCANLSYDCTCPCEVSLWGKPAFTVKNRKYALLHNANLGER